MEDPFAKQNIQESVEGIWIVGNPTLYGTQQDFSPLRTSLRTSNPFPRFERDESIPNQASTNVVRGGREY